MNADHYCAELVAHQNADFRYCLLGMSAPQRRALIAVQAFCLETTAIPQQCHDLGVAKAKLDWWRNEVGRLFAGTPTHPISRALQTPIAAYNLAEEYFSEVLDGVGMDVDYDLYPSWSDLTLYLHRQGSTPALLSAAISGYQDQRATPRFAHEAGIALQLFQQLYQVRDSAQQGYCYIPEDEMQRFGVSLGDLLAAQTSDRVRQLFAFQAHRIHDYQHRAATLLPDCDRLAQCHLLMRIELAMALLEEIITEGYALLEQRTQLTPLRKLWLAWTLRRRESRHRKARP